MATGNADPGEDFRLLPGTSAAGLNRAALFALVGGGAVVLVSVGAILVANAIGSPLPSGLVAIPLIAVGVSLVGRLLSFAAGRRTELEAEAGYTTVAGRPNLPRRDPRTGVVIPAAPTSPSEVRLNAVSEGTTLLGDSAGFSATPRPDGARFRRGISLIVTVGGTMVIAGVVVGLRVMSDARRSDDLDSAASTWLWVLIPTVVILALFLLYYGISGASAIRAVRVVRPDAVVFCSTATVDGKDALPLLGATGDAPRGRFTVAMDRDGLELRRMGEKESFVQVAWSAVVSVEPGSAALPTAVPQRAIILGVRVGDAAPLSLPLPVFEPRMPWMFPLSAANTRLDQMRALWAQSHRAARNQRAASGGSVSSTEAGRPAQGSSTATTEP